MRDKKTVAKDALEASAKELLARGFAEKDVAAALREVARELTKKEPVTTDAPELETREEA